MRTSIIVKLQIEGLHNWPEAKILKPEVAFLTYIHRHIFHITVQKTVKHDDRDVEIILFKRSIEAFLTNRYHDKSLDILCFGAMSCEMIAKQILEEFDCTSVAVLEDGENGAICSQ